MRPIRFALAAPFALAFALAACGGGRDASDDAMADSVEFPADEAMTDMPMPVEAAPLETPAPVPPAERVEEDARTAADEAQAAVDDAIAAAEDRMD